MAVAAVIFGMGAVVGYLLGVERGLARAKSFIDSIYTHVRAGAEDIAKNI